MPPMRCNHAVRLIIITILLLGSAACSYHRTAPEVSVVHGGSMIEPPLCRTETELLTHDGNIVRVTGHYEVKSLGMHRIMKEMPDGTMRSSNRISIVRFNDGTRVRLGIRSDDEMGAFDGMLVMVTGRVLSPTQPEDPNMAQPDEASVLIDIQDVQLDGE